MGKELLFAPSLNDQTHQRMRIGVARGVILNQLGHVPHKPFVVAEQALAVLGINSFGEVGFAGLGDDQSVQGLGVWRGVAGKVAAAGYEYADGTAQPFFGVGQIVQLNLKAFFQPIPIPRNKVDQETVLVLEVPVNRGLGGVERDRQAFEIEVFEPELIDKQYRLGQYPLAKLGSLRVAQVHRG